MTQGQFKIARRFRGPSDSGNGGYCAGSIAQIAGLSPARITLLAPPPLDQELSVMDSERGIVVKQADGTVVASCKPGMVDVTCPPIPTFAQARAAAERFIMSEQHFFPECFTCGTDRADDGGLGIFPGQLDSSEVVATTWTPDISLPSEDGVLSEEIVWAALDCPGAFGCMRGTVAPMVLGRMCAEIRRPVPIGKPLIVLGWPVASEGSRESVGTALADEGGQVLAVAMSVWVRIADDHAGFRVEKRPSR